MCLSKTNKAALFESVLNIYFSYIDSLSRSVAVVEHTANHPGALSKWCDVTQLPIAKEDSEDIVNIYYNVNIFKISFAFNMNDH